MRRQTVFEKYHKYTKNEQGIRDFIKTHSPKGDIAERQKLVSKHLERLALETDRLVMSLKNLPKDSKTKTRVEANIQDHYVLGGWLRKLLKKLKHPSMKRKFVKDGPPPKPSYLATEIKAYKSRE